MDDSTVDQMDKEVLQTLRDLALWAADHHDDNAEINPELAKALALLERIDRAQPELPL